MTTKTRYFLLGGVTFLVFGLAGGLVAYYGGVPAIGAFAREPAELLYVPEDATVVAFADVRAVMDSELRQQIRQLLPEPASAAESNGRRQFEEYTGIDLERDVEHVVAYLLPAAEQGAADHGLVLVRGRFDQPRIEQLVVGHGGAAETYRGKRFLVRSFSDSAGPVPSPNPQSPTPDSRLQSPEAQSLKPEAQSLQPDRMPEMAVGFIQPGLVGVGTGAALRRAIDLESGIGLDITRNDQFMSLVRDSDEGNAWAVGRFDRLVGRARLPAAVVTSLPPITHFAASGHVNGGLSTRLRVEARDEQAAQQLHDVVRGFVALARMQAGSRPELGTNLQSIQLQAEGKSVVLAVTVPAGVLQTLVPQRPPQ